jgi:hypothetical protein
MSELSQHANHNRPSGGERVFTDAAGRLWSAAALAEEDRFTVIFTCISDGRQSGRAIVVDPVMEVGDVEEDTLRAWLEAAPRIGRLN